MTVIRERTQVAIVGAGPAGLLLGRLLHRQGIEAVIVEARSRAYVEARIRAGVLEQGTIEVLREAGVGERMDREGLPHGGIYINYEGMRHHIPMSELTGGRGVMIYGQTEVVKDLIAARLKDGAPLLFDCSDVSVDGVISDEPVVRYTHNGLEHELQLRADRRLRRLSRGVPLGDPSTRPDDLGGASTRSPGWGSSPTSRPSTDELIYAQHERGFALHSMRSPTVSRLYIQVAPAENIDDWPDDRIWSELHQRLATDGWELTEGPVIEKSITPMRSFVASPMRYGRLLLAGDAAHIVPPTGAKGLNLAVADVTVLAEALTEHFRNVADAALDEYSDRCTRRVWRAQHFSWWMTTMLHQDPGADEYGRELQRSQLRYTCSSEAAMTSLAENYVGLRLRETAVHHG